MDIWIIEIGEPLPIESGARLFRYGQFTKALGEYGHDVTWWASSFSHSPKKQLVGKDTDLDLESFRLRLIHGPGYKNNISLARIHHQRHFAERFIRLAEKSPKPDLIISTVPTIESAYAAAQYAGKRNIPFLVDIRDLWPDEIRDLAPSFLRPLAEQLLRKSYSRMRQICRSATGILAVSESYLRYGLQFAGRHKGPTDCVFPLTCLPPLQGSDNEQDAQIQCERLGIDKNKFVICFFGTIGQFFNLKTPIEAAKILSRELPLLFVFGGDGSRMNEYRRAAKGMDSVVFTGWLNQTQISSIMKFSKAGLAPYKTGAKMSLPNKPFEYMAGGLPVVSSLEGEIKGLLETHHCGLSYHSDSVDELCSIIRLLHDDSALCSSMGQNAFHLWNSSFRPEIVFEYVNNHLLKIASQDSHQIPIQSLACQN